jgi:branched-chain amino acid transport system permease protein
MTGMSFRALIQSKNAAQLVGISVDRVHLLSFVCAFGLAGLAGGLVSMYSQVSPFMGFPYTVAAFVIIILGGLGDVFGSLLGGLILGILETFGVAWIGATFRSVLIYGVFIAIILWRPQGLLRSRKSTR